MEPSTLIRHVGCAGHLREGVWVMLIQTSSRYNLLFGGQGDNFAAVISLAIRHLQYKQSPPSRRLSRFTNNAAEVTGPLPQDSPPSRQPPPDRPVLQVCRAGGRSSLEKQVYLPSRPTKATPSHGWAAVSSRNSGDKEMDSLSINNHRNLFWASRVIKVKHTHQAPFYSPRKPWHYVIIILCSNRRFFYLKALFNIS